MGVSRLIGDAETAAGYRRRHEQHEHGARAVEAESLPHLRQEEGREAAGLAENLPALPRRGGHGVYGLVHVASPFRLRRRYACGNFFSVSARFMRWRIRAMRSPPS